MNHAKEMKTKPSRKELVAVIQQLQGVIGQVKTAILDDRNKDRMKITMSLLEDGFNLCVDSVRFDPPKRSDK